MNTMRLLIFLMGLTASTISMAEVFFVNYASEGGNPITSVNVKVICLTPAGGTIVYDFNHISQGQTPLIFSDYQLTQCPANSTLIVRYFASGIQGQCPSVTLLPDSSAAKVSFRITYIAESSSLICVPSTP